VTALPDPECRTIINAYKNKKAKNYSPSSWLAKDPMYRRSGSSFDLKSIREYQSFDDPRAIDWKLFARSGKAFVKEFYDEGSEGAAFLLDASASMKSHSYSHAFISSLAYILLGLGTALDVWAFSGGRLGTRLCLRGMASHAGFAKAVQEMVYGGKTDVNRAFAMLRAQCKLKRIFVFSDFHEQDFMPLLPRSGKLFLVRFYRPFAELAKDSSEVEVTDPESGKAIVLPWDKKTRNELDTREAEKAFALSGKQGLYYFVMGEGQKRLPFYWKIMDSFYE